MKIFDGWEKILKEMTRKQVEQEGETDIKRMHLYCDAKKAKPSLQLETHPSDSSRNMSEQGKEPSTVESASHLALRPKRNILNEQQRKAHDKIEQHMFGGELDQNICVAFCMRKQKILKKINC